MSGFASFPLGHQVIDVVRSVFILSARQPSVHRRGRAFPGMTGALTPSRLSRRRAISDAQKMNALRGQPEPASVP